MLTLSFIAEWPEWQQLYSLRLQEVPIKLDNFHQPDWI